MCNVSADVMAKMEKTVRQFLESGRMFTAYDVTIETREREKMQLRHQDVGGACHEVESLVDAIDYGYQNASGFVSTWQRTRRDLPGSSGAWAWVYHQSGLDPHQYQFHKSGKQQAFQPSAGQAKPAPALSISVADGSVSDSGGEQDDGTYAVDFRNRLMIPTRFMREAGIEPGDECYVVSDSNANMVIVCKNTPALQVSGLKVTTQKVERDGDLRLASRTLKAAEMTDSKFVIETADKDIGGGSTAKVVLVKAT